MGTDIAPISFGQFAGSIGDLTRVSPFSHRDNATFTHILAKVVEYLKNGLHEDINNELQRILDEFRDALAGNEAIYNAFVTEINRQVMLINNRVGPESMHRVGLAADYTVNIDPAWPDAHPIRFQFTQDAAGGRVVSFGVGIMGTALVDPAPLAMTEIELVPDGAGNWRLRTLNKPEAINVAKEFGARPGGIFDNTVKFNAAMDEARATGREVFIPTGIWYVSGEVNISGAVIRGVSRGYEGRGTGGNTIPVDGAATIIRGSGNNIAFNQTQVSPLSNVRCGVHGIRFENVKTGLRVSYSVYSHFSDIVVADSTGDGIICGDITIIGPLWNVFDRCISKSVNGYGLRLSGKDWCNANMFNSCFFQGTTGAINLTSASGFGSIANSFVNTEIVSPVGPGLVFNGKNRSTTLEKCFIEPKGPGIVVNESTSDLQLIGNAYGSTRNNIVGYGPYFIDHKLSNLSVRVLGGWITTGAIPEQTDLRFIGSVTPANLLLEFISEPRLETASTGFKLFDETVISAAQTVHRGNLLVKKYSAPSIELSYADGTRLFTIKRNGTQGGADFGVAFTNEGNTAFTITNTGMTIFNGHVAYGKAVPIVASPGVPAFKAPAYNAAQEQIGWTIINTGAN